MADEKEYKLPMTGEELKALLDKANNSLEGTYDPDTKTLKIFGGGYQIVVDCPNEDNAENILFKLASKGDVARISAEIADLKTEGVQQIALFAKGSTIDECKAWANENGDTENRYVFSDDFFYEYRCEETVVGGYTNYADTSSEDWWTNSRLDSSGNQATTSGADVSCYIPYTDGQLIRIKNVAFNTSGRWAVYDSSKTRKYLGSYSTLANCITTEDDGTLVLDTSGFKGINASAGGGAYIRLPLMSGENQIITVGEEIVDGTVERVYDWFNTGKAFIPSDYEPLIKEATEKSKQNAVDIINLTAADEKMNARITALEEGNNAEGIPDYWYGAFTDSAGVTYTKYLTEKIATIKALQDAGGKDCFSCIVITDIHFESNLAKLAPLLAKRIAETCGIKYIIILGDTQTRHGANHGYEYIENEWVEIENMLSPIRGQLLITLGNHDGSYDIIDENADGVADDINSDGVVNSYDKNVYNYPPQKLHERVFRKVRCIDNVHFSSDGNGYYVDDTGNKVRYIILNSHVNKYALNADGSMKYNNMYNFRFGQSQYDMVIEALKTVPSDEWYVIFGSHVGMDRSGEYVAWGGEVDSNGAQTGNPADCVIMQRMLNAYYNKTSYSGSFAGTQDGFDAVSVNVDFSDAKGQIMAYHSGHVHKDIAWGTTYGWNGAEHSDFYIISTRCDGRTENEGDLMNERVAGTITEQSFDVFTYNKAERKIYATKIGAGSDRVITY